MEKIVQTRKNTERKAIFKKRLVKAAKKCSSKKSDYKEKRDYSKDKTNANFKYLWLKSWVNR